MRFPHICMVCLLALTSPVMAQETLPWTVVTAFPLSSDPSEEGGPSARIAVNPENGRPVVAFLEGDSEPGTELVILYDYPAGPLDGWERIGFATGNPISDLDMDFWISSSTWKIGLSYRDRSSQSLWFREVVYNRNTQTQTSTSVRIEETDDYNYGVGTSIRYGHGGVPHIAAYVSTFLGSDSLFYARFVGAGGNCGFGSGYHQWSCETIDSGSNTGRDPSIAIDGGNDPVIAYTREYGDLDIVFVARPSATGAGNCGAGNWNCDYVDLAGSLYNQGKASVYYDDSPEDTGLHVAFLQDFIYDTLPMTVKHAVESPGNQGNCGIDDEWVCELVPGRARGDSMELATNAAGDPVLAYRAGTLDEVAYVEYLGVVGAGNCGSTLKWSCGVLEPDLGGSEMGDWLDLAVNAAGRPQVVYSRYLTSEMRSELRLAFPPIFSDGFESGDVGAWSSSTP